MLVTATSRSVDALFRRLEREAAPAERACFLRSIGAPARQVGSWWEELESQGPQ